MLVADVLFDAATAIDSLKSSVDRRTELTRDAGAIDRALIALTSAVNMLRADVQTIAQGSGVDLQMLRDRIALLATAADLTALAARVTAVETLAAAPVTQQQLLDRMPAASESTRGLERYATRAEILAGAATNRGVSVRRLLDRTATETRLGLAQLATRPEVEEVAAPSGTDFERVPSIGAIRAYLLATTTRRASSSSRPRPRRRAGKVLSVPLPPLASALTEMRGTRA